MKSNELSDLFLLFQYSNVLSQINELYKQKKELESEISSRAEHLKDMYRTGKIQMEKEDTENE